MANEKNKPFGSGKAETQDTEDGPNSGISQQKPASRPSWDTRNGRDQSGTQNTGQSMSSTPEAGRSSYADRDRDISKDGAGSRDGATGGNPDGMRKDSTNDPSAGRTSGDDQRENDIDRLNRREAAPGSVYDGAEGTEGSVNDRDTDSDEATDNRTAGSDRGPYAAGGM